MDLKAIMKENVFAVVGDTIKEEKYAFKIKNELIDHGYTAYGVGKELKSLNEIDEDIDIVDLCINPIKGLELIMECKKKYKCVVIQPGAESDELIKYMKENNIQYIEGCLLVGLKLFGKKKKDF